MWTEEEEVNEPPPEPPKPSVQNEQPNYITPKATFNINQAKSFCHSQPYEKAKWRSIYTKNMTVSLPSIDWLPGRSILFLQSKDNTEILQEFTGLAYKFGVFSLMIFITPTETKVSFSPSCVALTVPGLTIVFDLRILKEQFSFPEKIIPLFGDTKLRLITPGDKDYHMTQQHDVFNGFRGMTSNILTRLNDIKVDLSEYISYLKLNNGGKNICDHMKLIHFIFQAKMKRQTYNDAPPMSLTSDWLKMAGEYGLLLICLYWALEEKRISFFANSIFGANCDPMYLEDILIKYQVVTDMNKDELKGKIIKFGNYPSPPVPNFPRPQ